MHHVTRVYLLTIILFATKPIQNQFSAKPILSEQTRTLFYDKKSFRNADVRKGFGKYFLIQNNIENEFLANSLK